MDLEIRDFDTNDIGLAADYAITGMQLDKYASGLVLKVYGRYFVSLELQRATQAIAAYEGEKLVGLLIAAMDGEPARWKSPLRGLFVGLVAPFAKIGEGGYTNACRQMLDAYQQGVHTDGELCFFVADPECVGKGIGSLLLAEFARREAGKQIYLFTDSNCTWQFYEKRNFDRVGQRTANVGVGKGAEDFECYLYAKTL